VPPSNRQQLKPQAFFRPHSRPLEFLLMSLRNLMVQAQVSVDCHDLGSHWSHLADEDA
jgi:hypothetical protein